MKYPRIEVAILLAIFILIMTLGTTPSLADDPHHKPGGTVVDNYSINKTVETNGQAALYAADQIHPSENISGLQLGFGAAEHDQNVGFAAGAALNVKGWGMINGSVAKESDIEPFIGIGINLSLKP